MVQWAAASDTLPEDLSLVPSTHVWLTTICDPVLAYLMYFSGLCRYQACKWYTGNMQTK